MIERLLDEFEKAIKVMEVLLEDCNERDKYHCHKDKIDGFKTLVSDVRDTERLKRRYYTGHC